MTDTAKTPWSDPEHDVLADVMAWQDAAKLRTDQTYTDDFEVEVDQDYVDEYVRVWGNLREAFTAASRAITPRHPTGRQAQQSPFGPRSKGNA